MKHVQACLSARKDGESSVHHCGGPVKLVQTCLCAGNTLQRRFHRRCEARAGQFVPGKMQISVFTTVETL